CPMELSDVSPRQYTHREEFMIKALVALLAVLVMASTSFAAYLANDPCQTTQRVESHSKVASTVKPDQRMASASLTDAASQNQSTEKVVLATGVVSSTEPAKCPVSYFGVQDATRSLSPESGGSSGDSGAASGG